MTVTIQDSSHTVKLTFDDNQLAQQLMGAQAANLQRLKSKLPVTISARGTAVEISGSQHDVELAARILTQLYELLRSGYPVYREDFDHALQLLSSDSQADLKKIFQKSIYISAKKKLITPRSQNQRSYLEAMHRDDFVFAIGPAGTGKTYLAVANALHALLEKRVSRVILSRPAVEAGEKLGFLPGDIIEKINPYLRPLYDALYDMVEYERIAHMMESGEIEVAPLAFMRGRTLSSAFVILDEAQNCTSEQMKMFLTRIGSGSQAVVAGDVTQIDLIEGKRSGLLEAEKILKGIPGISFCYFDQTDVVRHELVAEILKAYES